MARGRGNRLSRAFAELGSSGVREASRNLNIRLNGADGMVCQVQNHAQGADETIEVTVVPRRRLRRVIVRVENDEPSGDSSEPEVVVKTSKSGSGQNDRCPRQRQHMSNGRNDENLPPTRNDGHDDGPSVPTTASSSAFPRQPARSPVDRPTRPASMVSAFPRPLSAAFDLGRRISQLNSQLNLFKSSRATKDDKGKSKDAGDTRRLKRHSEMYRNGYHGCDNDHDPVRRKSPRAESSGFSTPASYLDDYEHRCHSCGRIRNSEVQKEHPVYEGRKVIRNLCSACRRKLEHGLSQVLGPDGEDLSQKYWCTHCGFQRSPRYRIENSLSGAAEPGSPNICTYCVKKAQRRKEDKRREEERRRAAALLESKLPPTQKERTNNDVAESPRAHHQNNPPSASSTTFSTASTYSPERRSNYEKREKFVRSDFVLAPAPTRRRRVPRYSPTETGPSQLRQDDTSTNTNDKSGGGEAKVDTTTRAAGRDSSRMAYENNEAMQTEIDSTTRPAGCASSRMAYNNNEAIQPEVESATQAAGYRSSNIAFNNNEVVQTEIGDGNDNGTASRNAAAPAPATVEGGQDDEAPAEEARPEGFIHNSAAAWAAIEMDDVLLHAITMDPAERAARRARLYSKIPPRSYSPVESSVRGASPALQFTGPRIVELTSDDEDE